MTLITAPAGYGKTTLAAAWLQEQPHPVAWLSLDESDSDLTGFLRYFVAAIHMVFPHTCANTQALLDSPLPTPLASYSRVLTNEIADLPGDLVLVLDDYRFPLKEILGPKNKQIIRSCQ